MLWQLLTDLPSTLTSMANRPLIWENDQVTAQPAEHVTESPDTRLGVFITLRTKERHRLTMLPWPRPLCMERFIIGQVTEAQVKDLTCERCIAWYDPITYEVRIPDDRFKTGYRVVHTAISDQDEALALTQDLNVEREAKGQDPAFIASSKDEAP